MAGQLPLKGLFQLRIPDEAASSPGTPSVSLYLHRASAISHYGLVSRLFVDAT